MAKPVKTTVPDPVIETVYTITQKSPGWTLVELQIDVSSGKIVSSNQLSEPDLLQITVAKLQQKIMAGG